MTQYLIGVVILCFQIGNNSLRLIVSFSSIFLLICQFHPIIVVDPGISVSNEMLLNFFGNWGYRFIHIFCALSF